MTSKNKFDKKSLLKLRDIRTEKGMSLNALAKKVGVDYQKVGRMERGETQMTLEMLYRIAKALQVPITKIIGEENIVDLQSKMSHVHNSEPSLYLIPSIYEKIEAFCTKHNIQIDNPGKVHLATVMYKAIQDIRTNVQDDVDMVKALFQVFDAIFERFLLNPGEQHD